MQKLLSTFIVLSFLFLSKIYGQDCNFSQVYATIDPFTSIYEKSIHVENQFNGYLDINGAEGFVTITIIENRASGNTVYHKTFGQNTGDFTIAPIPISLGPGPFGYENYLVRYEFTEGASIYGGAEINLHGQDCKIYGNSVVTTGTLEHFTFNNGNTVAQPNWRANGGTVINTERPSGTSTNYGVDINFHITGQQNIWFRDGENILGVKSITVNQPPENLRIQGPETVVQGEEVIYSFDNGNNFGPNWMDGSYQSINEWNEGTTYYIKLKWLYSGPQLLTLITTPPEMFLDEKIIDVLPAAIEGNKSPNSGSVEHYTYNRGRIIPEPHWQVKGGEVINTANPTGESTLYEVDINWIDTGNQEITILSGNSTVRAEEVSVGQTPEHLRIIGPSNVNLNEIVTYYYTDVQISPNWQTNGTILKEWTTGDLHYIKVVFESTGANFVNIRDASNQDVFLNRVEVNVSPLSPNRHNYVKTTEVLVEGITDFSQVENLSLLKKNATYEYFDGLGRTVQIVDNFTSPKGYDIVIPVTYDQYGRQSKQYLPVTVNESNGLFKENILDASGNYSGIAADFYASGSNNKVAEDGRPYSETFFEASPLNRPLKSYGPGKDWYDNDKHITHHYLVNEDGTGTGQEKIIAWTINDSGLPVRYKNTSFNNNSGYYPTGSLTIKVTKDEEGMAVREYTNKQGQVILKKVQLVKHEPLDLNNGEYWVQTYYVYDDLGNLRFVLTPELVHKLVQSASTNPSITDLKNFAFQYKYDERQRVTEKHVPGGGNTYMVYDKWDRLALTQNEEQKLDNKWHYTKYDVFNRPIITGIYTDSRTNVAIQIALESATVRYESLNPQPGASSVYTNLSFPKANTEALTAIYYDNYDFLMTADWDVEGNNYSYVDDGLSNPVKNGRVIGQITGGKVKILNTDTWLNSVVYYDDYYNPIQTINENYQDGTDRESSQYDFSRKLLKTVHVHSGIENHKIVKNFEYDHAGRLLKVYHKVDQAPTVLLVKNEYNELGELVDKHLHATNSAETEFLQSVDYRYNIRGWLTRINNSDLSPDAGDANHDLFGMGLFYNFGFDKPRYNGNISGARWKNVVDYQERAYGYTYDPLNRFTGADYVAGGTGNWTQEADRFEVGNISYDHNGNLKSLDRNGLFSHSPEGAPAYGITDQLVYKYKGNQLVAVNDAIITPATTPGDFKDNGSRGSPDNPEYDYDENGNLTRDGNKGINITYNSLNLPERVDFEDEKYIEYVYDASGAKLQQKVHDGENSVIQTDYDFGIVYENGELQSIQHEEGRVLPKDGGGWEYQYYFKDHLGNVRLSFTSEPETDTDKATMETADEDNDRAEFLYYDQVTKINSDIFDHTNNGETHYSLRLNGTEDERIGLAKSLAVLPGDVINAKVHAKYIDHGESEGWSDALKALIASIAGGTAPAGTVIDGLPLPSGESYPFPGLPDKSGDAPENPKAYLNFLVFDKHRNLIEEKSGYLPVTTTAKEDGTGVEHEELNTDRYGDIVIEEEGYVYIYLSNDNPEPMEVYFDDFEVTLTQSPVIQGNDYYPYGMEIAGLSYSKENSVANNYRFQSDFSEKSDLTGWNSFYLRNYDSQIGRWTSVDPYDQYPSAYLGMGNNPVNGVDPDGGWLFGLFGSTSSQRQEARVFAELNNGVINNWWSSNINVTYTRMYFDSEINDFSVAVVNQSFRDNGRLEHGSLNVNAAMDNMEFFNTPLASGEIQFDALTQLSLGMAAGSMFKAISTLPTALEGSSNFLRGGKTFSQYKASYWSGRAKPTLDPIINPKTGQVWKLNTELHHRFIPQRAKWAPNWLKNNRLNLTPKSSLRHAQMDPYRARFAPKWIKEIYNLKWK